MRLDARHSEYCIGSLLKNVEITGQILLLDVLDNLRKTLSGTSCGIALDVSEVGRIFLGQTVIRVQLASL